MRRPTSPFLRSVNRCECDAEHAAEPLVIETYGRERTKCSLRSRAAYRAGVCGQMVRSTVDPRHVYEEQSSSMTSIGTLSRSSGGINASRDWVLSYTSSRKPFHLKPWDPIATRTRLFVNTERYTGNRRGRGPAGESSAIGKGSTKDPRNDGRTATMRMVPNLPEKRDGFLITPARRGVRGGIVVYAVTGSLHGWIGLCASARILTALGSAARGKS